MNLMGHIRHLRWLPRMLLAAVVMAVMQTTLMPCAMADAVAPMGEHCVYCPPVVPDVPSDCAFPHAPTVDVYAASAHHMSVLFNSPLLQPVTFGVAQLREFQTIYPPFQPVTAPSRRINLTHCVQLK
jgi:hypothetical protein